jgi:hypothetical protein
MTAKKARRLKGKEIRRATGIKLPVAMRVGKAILGGMITCWLLDKGLDYLNANGVKVESVCHNLEGDMWWSWTIIGPKGRFEL